MPMPIYNSTHTIFIASNNARVWRTEGPPPRATEDRSLPSRLKCESDSCYPSPAADAVKAAGGVTVQQLLMKAK
jgi:hypothetical protein